jgi:hypothetical protein
MQNAKFYEFSSFQAKSCRLNDYMLIFERQDNFEMQVCDSFDHTFGQKPLFQG